MRSRRRRDAGLVLAIALISAGCAGQSTVSAKVDAPAVGFGKPISEADIAPWDIDIRTSDGKGLPPGRGSVAQGRTVYEQRCQACHGPEAKGGPVYGTMVG